MLAKRYTFALGEQVACLLGMGGGWGESCGLSSPATPELYNVLAGLPWGLRGGAGGGGLELA